MILLRRGKSFAMYLNPVVVGLLFYTCTSTSNASINEDRTNNRTIDEDMNSPDCIERGVAYQEDYMPGMPLEETSLEECVVLCRNTHQELCQSFTWKETMSCWLHSSKTQNRSQFVRIEGSYYGMAVCPQLELNGNQKRGEDTFVWSCPRLDRLWGTSHIYEIKEWDFCSTYTFWLTASEPVYPECNANTAPVIQYYDVSSLEESNMRNGQICTVNMRKSVAVNQNCIKLLSDYFGKSSEYMLVYVVHGLQKGNISSHWLYEMKNAILRRFSITNSHLVVGVVSWGLGSQAYMVEVKTGKGLIGWKSCHVSNYAIAAANTMVVGHSLGLLTSWLVDDINSNGKIFCLGHSLGGHVCGFAGKTFPGFTGILGLDPAGPIFDTNSENGRLSSNDAQSVHILHTNIGAAGIYKPIGHVDFYPDGGDYHPGCPYWFGVTCNHRFAYRLLIQFYNKYSDHKVCKSNIRCKSNPTDNKVVPAFPVSQGSIGGSQCLADISFIEVGDLNNMLNVNFVENTIIWFKTSTESSTCKYII